jgi:hypothetical protein
MNPHINIGHDCSISLPNTATLTAGNHVVSFAFDDCRIQAGDGSFVQCRDRCSMILGANSNIDAGNNSTIQTGPDSNVIVGPGSVVSAGDNSEIRFTWWFGNKLEVTVCRIGKNGILPNTPYKIIDGRINVVN